MKTNNIFKVLLLLIVISCSNNSDDNNPSEPNLSSESNINSFQINSYQLGETQINTTNKTISIEVTYGAPITQLVASFSVSVGSTVNIDGVDQVSGTTSNDFSNPITYNVIAEDGETESNWTVTVTEQPPATESAINSFQIINYQEGTTTIDNSNNTIHIDVAFNAPTDALVANFSISDGATINVSGTNQESGVTVNDFSSSVVYTVIAQDATSETNWTVNVNTLPEPPFSVNTLVTDFPGNDGISVDSNDNIYVNSNGIVNQWNGTTIYKVTPHGDFELFHDNLPSWPVGSIFDSNEDLYVTGWNAPGIITKISYDGSTSEQFYSGIGEPSGLEIDNNGNIYVMEPPTNKMIKIDQNGVRTDFVVGGTFNKASGITFDKVNELFYVTNWNDGVISRVDMTGTITTFATLPINNLGPIIIVDNYLYTTSYNGNSVFRVNIDTSEHDRIGTGAVGNNDGYGNEATFRSPLGVGISNDKTKLYISEVAPTGNGRLRVITFNE